MSEWYLWDGESQIGPMDRGELENCIHDHPNPNAVCVWRNGFSDWKTVKDAFDLVSESDVEAASASEVPLERSTKSSGRNFFARHWRGEFPLGASYWLIGTFANILAFLVVGLMSALSAGLYSPTGILLFYLSLWSLLSGLSIWQLVGVWRSANRRRDERAAMGKRALWAGAAKIMVCLGVLQTVLALVKSGGPQIAEATRIAFMDDPRLPPYAIRVMNDGSEAEISGGIKFGLSSDFEKILNASRGIRIVHLDSIGGRLGEGERLNALIKDRGLDTYVDVKCLSACTLAFVGGRQRLLKKGAQLGFHRGAYAGEERFDGTLERSIFAAAGVSGRFVDRVLATKNADIWLPSEADLVAAGVVTKVTAGDEYAIAGDGGRITRDDWDKALQKAFAIYKVVKEKYPKSYEEILDMLADAAAKGTPQGKLTEQARAKLNDLIKSQLPNADDGLLVEFGKLTLEEFSALRRQDKTACYRFASGQNDSDLLQLIPEHLTKRELELDTQILSSARRQQAPTNNDEAWERIRTALGRRGYTAKDIELFNAGATNSADYGRYCDIAIDLYQEVVTLPSRDAAGILREFFS